MPDSVPPQPDDQPAVPASVTFTEMMRQVASSRQPPPAPARQPSPAPPAAPPPAAADDHQQRAAALEEERIRRIKRRGARRRRTTVGVLGGMLRSFMVALAAAGLMATIFTWWTPPQFIASSVRTELGAAQAAAPPAPAPTIQPTPNWFQRIGVVAGHRGPESDPGAVCPDGLTEASVNFNVAQGVVRGLRALGYSVDLLDEFDPRLENYQAAALVSIHSNTCQAYPGEVVSGYLISAAAARITARGNDDLLVDCIAQHYQAATGLQRRDGVTPDMTDYHTFREIHPRTPAAIIELGFLLADRALLTDQTDTLAAGIVDGIICYLDPGRALPAADQP